MVIHDAPGLVSRKPCRSYTWPRVWEGATGESCSILHWLGKLGSWNHLESYWKRQEVHWISGPSWQRWSIWARTLWYYKEDFSALAPLLPSFFIDSGAPPRTAESRGGGSGAVFETIKAMGGPAGATYLHLPRSQNESTSKAAVFFPKSYRTRRLAVGRQRERNRSQVRQVLREAGKPASSGAIAFQEAAWWTELLRTMAS